jgi:phosphatidylglycerol:prolipoprotein diacylglycerol transferase
LPPVPASISYQPVPIFDVGPFRLSLHGVFAGVGFVAGAILMIRHARTRGFDEVRISSVLTWALVGAVLGARLFTVPAHLGDPGYGFDDVVNPAGFYSIMGGMAGGVLAGVLRMRLLDLVPLPHLDMAAYGLALGTVVGRIGDLFIVEHLGGRTDFFLGFLVKPGYDLAPQHDGLEQLCADLGECGPYHHAALYDMVGAGLLLGGLYLVASRGRFHYGQLFVLWAGWYGVQRFLIDFTRNTDLHGADAALGPLTWNQWSGLAIGVAAAVVFRWLQSRTPTVGPEQDAAYGARRREAEPEAEPAAS